MKTINAFTQEAELALNHIKSAGKRISIVKNWSDNTYAIGSLEYPFEISKKMYSKLINYLNDKTYFEDDDFDGYNCTRKETKRALKSMIPTRAQIIDEIVADLN